MILTLAHRLNNRPIGALGLSRAVIKLIIGLTASTGSVKSGLVIKTNRRLNRKQAIGLAHSLEL